METGRHAAFIWSAYGATAIMIGGLIGRAVLGHRRETRTLAGLVARAGARREAEAGDR